MSGEEHTREAERRDGEAVLVAAREFDASALRTCWSFDPTTHERHYVREDVSLAGVDVECFLDNERYGFVTRDTYDALHPAEYRYTVRGFDGVEVFRWFFDDSQVGVLCSFDADGAKRNYGALAERLRDAAGDDPERVAPGRTARPSDAGTGGEQGA